MKKLLIVTILFFFALNIGAQTQQGKIFVSADSKIAGTIGSTSLKYDGTTVGSSTTSLQFNLSPSVGYFLIDNFVVGLTIDLTTQSLKAGSEKQTSTTYAVGPMGRFYIGTSNVKPFVGASFLLGSQSSTYTPSTGSAISSGASGIIVMAGGGIAFYVNDHVAIEGQISYMGESLKNKDDSKEVEKANQIYLAVGFSLSF